MIVMANNIKGIFDCVTKPFTGQCLSGYVQGLLRRSHVRFGTTRAWLPVPLLNSSRLIWSF